MIKKILIANIVIFSSLSYGRLPIGKAPTPLTLSDHRGGRLDGNPWNSSELKGKVHVLVYADPDEADLNKKATEALKAKSYPSEKFASVAVINMAATWKPNFAIEMVLKKKQEKFKRTLYLKDYKKALVKEWSLKDDSNNIVVFDKDGVVVFSIDGKLTDAQITQMLKAIEDNLDQPTPPEEDKKQPSKAPKP